MADTLLRHWQMLRLIPRAPRKVSTAQLASQLADRGFVIDRRSIQRDLLKLSAHFPLVVDERARPYGWSWMRDAALFDMPGMDLHTALAFALADRHLGHLLPATTLGYLRPHFQHAQQVLDHLDHNDLAAWRASVRVLPRGQPMTPPSVSAPVLEALHDGLLRRRCLEVLYRRRGEQPTRYLAHPQGLVHRGELAYLVASVKSYDNVIQMAVHRFESVRVLDQPRRELPAFNLDDYIAQGGFGFQVGVSPVTVTLRFTHSAVVRLRETPLAVGQQIIEREDGRFDVTATVPDTVELRAWIKGYGAMCEVVAPQALRDEIAAELLAAAQRYAEETS